MFFVKDLEYPVQLHPSFFNSGALEKVKRKVYDDVEGTTRGNMLIVAVVGIREVSEPAVQSGTGYALYNVAYQALIWVPFRGEVVDGRVTSVLATGLFTEVGGTKCFVTRQLMPSNLKFSMDGSTPSYSDDEGNIIERDSEIRLRIKGIRGEIGNMFAIGSMKEDYLGPLNI